MGKIGFYYENGKLYSDGVEVKKIASEYGTPLYIYSGNLFEEKIKIFKESFSEFEPLICYSIKSNSNVGLLQIVNKNGIGVDIVSRGELYRAKRVGIPGERIVFAGVGKTEEEIKEALEYNIFLFNVESIPEAYKISEIAGKLGKKASIAIRINPNVDAHTHKHITTGKKENKFGIDLEIAEKYFKEINELPNIELIGVHAHIGSQITKIDPYKNALKRTINFIKKLREAQINIRVLNIGGGYGIKYRENENSLDIKELAKEIKDLIRDSGCKLIMEPGRFISGPSGILVCKVIYVKKGIAKTFVITDGSMTELIRPALYEGYHIIKNVEETSNRKKIVADIVGPVCESADFLGKDREIYEIKEGELLAVFNSGAYGFVMSSNYNSRLMVAEVVTYKGNYYLTRERQNYADIVEKERFLPDNVF